MTTIASLSYISLTQILYSYNSPLSYNTMSIQFSLPRMLYKDEEFAFVIGQDLSDVNSEPARLNIIITRADGVILYLSSLLTTSTISSCFPSWTRRSSLQPAMS